MNTTHPLIAHLLPARRGVLHWTSYLALMEQGMIDDSDFKEGFRQGFRAVRGSAAAIPTIPAQPATRAGRTAFQMGLLRGIERAKKWDRDYIRGSG